MEEISGSISLVGIALSLYVIMATVSGVRLNNDLSVLSIETAVTLSFEIINEMCVWKDTVSHVGLGQVG